MENATHEIHDVQNPHGAKYMVENDMCKSTQEVFHPPHTTQRDAQRGRDRGKEEGVGYRDISIEYSMDDGNNARMHDSESMVNNDTP